MYVCNDGGSLLRSATGVEVEEEAFWGTSGQVLGTGVVFLLSPLILLLTGGDEVGVVEELVVTGEVEAMPLVDAMGVQLLSTPVVPPLLEAFTLIELLLVVASRLCLFIATLVRCFRLPTSFLTGFVNFTVECMFPFGSIQT